MSGGIPKRMADVQQWPVRSPSQRAEDCSMVAHNFSRTCVLRCDSVILEMRYKFSSPTSTHAAPRLYVDEAEFMQYEV